MAVSSLLTLAIVVWDTAELSLWRVRFILGQDLMHMSILFNLRQHTAEMTTFDGDLHYTASSMQFCKMILLISWGGGIIHPSSLHFLKCLSSLHFRALQPPIIDRALWVEILTRQRKPMQACREHENRDPQTHNLKTVRQTCSSFYTALSWSHNVIANSECILMHFKWETENKVLTFLHQFHSISIPGSTVQGCLPVSQ